MTASLLCSLVKLPKQPRNKAAEFRDLRTPPRATRPRRTHCACCTRAQLRASLTAQTLQVCILLSSVGWKGHLNLICITLPCGLEAPRESTLHWSRGHPQIQTPAFPHSTITKRDENPTWFVVPARHVEHSGTFQNVPETPVPAAPIITVPGNIPRLQLVLLSNDDPS